VTTLQAKKQAKRKYTRRASGRLRTHTARIVPGTGKTVMLAVDSTVTRKYAIISNGKRLTLKLAK